MKDELQNYMDRPKKYDNIDGTGEMAMGLMLLGFALLSYLQNALPAHSLWRKGLFGLLLMYLVLIPMLGLGHGLQKFIKKRFTWPRTGYVAYRRDKKVLLPLFPIIILGASVSVGLGFIFAKARIRHIDGLITHGHDDALNLIRAIYPTIFLLVYGLWIYKMEREHAWKWLVLSIMALGLLMITLRVPGDLIAQSRPMCLFVGLMWFISGVATLFSYLRHTRPPIEEAE